MHIEELLYPTEEFIHQYEHYIQTGKEYLSTQKLCILGLTRNTPNTIGEVTKTLVKIGKSAKDYRIILFENDSIHDTKTIIDNACGMDANIELISENYNRPQFSSIKDPNRVKVLAEYRNKLKKRVAQNYNHYDFVIVSDTDFQNLSINGVYNSFGWLREKPIISAMCGNSYEYKKVFDADEKESLWNYDCWAYRGSWWNNLQTKNGTSVHYNPMLWFGLQILPVGSHPFRINSGFGGMTIYRNNFFLMGNYSGEDCEHVMFHYDIKNKNNDFNLFLNPSQRMLLF